MTGPFAFLDNKTEQTPSPFDFLDQKKDEGAFSYLGNLAHNFGLAIAAQGYNSNDPVISPMADMMFRNNPGERQQIQAMQEQLKAANMKGGDTWNALKDKLQPSNLYNSFKDSIGNFLDSPSSVGDMVGGLAKGLVQAPGSLLEAGTGLNLGNDVATAMTPEERAQKIKDAAAVLVTGAVTATARFAMLKGLGSLATSVPAGATADVAANTIKQGGKLGLLGKQLVRSGSLGLAEGAIGGGTFGAVSGLGDEDQAGKIIGGMLFAPIGMVAEMIGAKVKGGDEISKIQEKAGQVFAMRQLGYSPDKSLFDLNNSIQAIATNDTPIEAVGEIKTPQPKIEIPKSPEIPTQLSKLIPNGTPNEIGLEPNQLPDAKIIKISARDDSGVPIGLLTLSKTGEKTADVFTVYVDPNYRRQGIATKLYDAAEAAGYKLRSGQSGLTAEGRAFVQNRYGTVPAAELIKTSKDAVGAFTDNLYEEFKSITDTPENTDGFDVNFSKFTQARNINAQDAGLLRNEFINRVHTEIHNALPLEERNLYRKLQQDLINKNESIVSNGTSSLKELAVRNGMYFDQADAGIINLRNMEDNKSIGIFHSVKDAQTYLDGIGEPKDYANLDGNGKIPPDGTKPLALPSNLGPQNPPATNISWLDKAQALTFSRLQWLTPNPSLFKNWDTQFGTTLFANVFDPVEAAYRKYEGAFNNNVIIPLRNIKAPFIKAGLNKADAETISHYLQTTSIDEFMQNGEYGKKPLTPLDIAAAHQLKGADLTAAMDYKHALRDVDPNDSKTINLLKQQFNITSNEENALNVIDAISKQPKELVTIYSSVKLARLLQNPELALTRADFAKKFNMNQVQLQAASALDAFYKKQADIAGIPEEGRLANYMTHARLYEKGNIGNTLTQLANSEKEKQFYAGMIRTGELSAYELDPFAAALRYGNALNRSIHLSPVISDAVKALREQVSNGVPKGAGDKVLRDANTFLNDVQQRRAIGDNYANAAVDAFHGYLGAMPDANVRTTWVNTINKYITAAAQAGRPFVGIRNFWQNGSMYFTKWGLDETRKVFSLGAHADLDSMKRDGLIQSYSPVGLGSAVDEDEGLLERVGSKLRTGLDKSTDFGMKLSGQQAVNERFAAGAFLNTRSNVAKMSRDLIAKKFGDNFEDPNTFQKAYHTLQLERYSDPVKVQFDKLIKSNKFDDAANFLANANIQETWGTYGNANAPSGWNNNLGRLVGKFGSWSVNHRDYIVSLASRGTRAQKLQALGRMALTEGSVAAAATTLGVNLSGFYSLPALMFNGGPTTGLVSTAMNALFGRGQAQNDAISKVQKLLPYNFQKDEFQRSILVPFSFGVGDLVDGLDMASNGDVAGGLMKIGGISPQSAKYKGSDFEEQVGETIGAK